MSISFESDFMSFNTPPPSGDADPSWGGSSQPSWGGTPPPQPPSWGAGQPPQQPPQQWGAGPQQPAGKPDNNLILAIFTTLCCCLPFGIASVIFAAKVDGLWASGQYAEAQKASQDAKKWAIVGIVGGLIGSILYVAASAVVGFGAETTTL